MKNVWLRVLALAAALSTSAFGGVIVYSNTTTDTLTSNGFAGNGATELGDTITLFGTERLATLATVQFFNSGTAAGTFDTTLRLFNVGAPVGSQIGSGVTVSGVSAPAGGIFNVSFVLPSLLVPDNLVFTVSADNSTAGVVMSVNLFNPPTPPGSSLVHHLDREDWWQLPNPGWEHPETSSSNSRRYRNRRPSVWRALRWSAWQFSDAGARRSSRASAKPGRIAPVPHSFSVLIDIVGVRIPLVDRSRPSAAQVDREPARTRSKNNARTPRCSSLQRSKNGMRAKANIGVRSTR